MQEIYMQIKQLYNAFDNLLIFVAFLTQQFRLQIEYDLTEYNRIKYLSP